MKNAQLRVDFDGFDWKNVITFTSPTGNTITFTTNGLSGKISEDLKLIIQKAHKTWKTAIGSFVGNQTVSYTIMEEIKQLGGR